VDPALVERGSRALVHRGPDDEGSYFSGNVGFGFRRLAILDLSAAGHQPMISPDGGVAIVFNGEIYNYLEVRRELQALGHEFSSGTDTEVLLHSYMQWGEECVHRFNGMWSFVIHDRRTNVLFGARDRMGVKPLYHWHDDNWIVLASEPKAIEATGLGKFGPNWSTIADFVAWNRLDGTEECCVAGVLKVPAGHRFRLDGVRGLLTEQYWGPPQVGAAFDAKPEAQWIEELGHLVTDSVRLRLRSDVPVGFTLSGGIDSTLLICESSNQKGSSAVETLAFAYQDEYFDESAQIADTIKQTGARLVSLQSSHLDPAALLPRIIAAHGEPVHSPAAVANYALYALARTNGVKVVLGGQGADEVLGGYGSYQQDYWHSLAAQRKWRSLVQDVRDYSDVTGKPARGLLVNTLVRSLRIAVSGTLPYRLARQAVGGRAPHNDFTALFNPDFLRLSRSQQMGISDYTLAATQRAAVSRWPLPLYMRIEDRSSMANSVEGRLPFTDYRIVEHALRMPDRLKFSGGINKIALRKVAERRIPPSVSARTQKFGFPVAVRGGSGDSLGKLCSDLVNSREFAERGIYSMPKIRELMSGSRSSGAGADASAKFQLVQMELWLRRWNGMGRYVPEAGS
jgi:asparagine synthase (glutamine-hydrolysing)